MTITSTGSSGSSSDRKTQQRKADLTSAVKKKDMIMDIAFGEGLKNGLATAVVVSAAVVGGHHASSSFKRFLSISAKASLPLMTGIFVGSLSTELSMQVPTNLITYLITSTYTYTFFPPFVFLPFHRPTPPASNV